MARQSITIRPKRRGNVLVVPSSLRAITGVGTPTVSLSAPGVESFLRFGPYTGMNGLVGAGPNDQQQAPRYKIVGITPQFDTKAEITAAIALADQLDITIIATTQNSPEHFFTAGVGFDITKYNAEVTYCSTIPGFSDAVRRGRIICLIGDEPYHSKWDVNGVNTWPPSVVNDCGRFHKQLFGIGTTCIIRCDAHRLRVGWKGRPPLQNYDGLDYAVFQYEGPSTSVNHTFMVDWNSDKADATFLNIGCIPSMNLWGGGNMYIQSSISECWDMEDNGTSSGVIAGSVQTGTIFTKGQHVPCSTWRGTTNANRKTAVCSPEFLKYNAALFAGDPTVPWFWYWMHVRQGSDFTAFGPLQQRQDFIDALGWTIDRCMTRSFAYARRTPKVYP